MATSQTIRLLFVVTTSIILSTAVLISHAAPIVDGNTITLPNDGDRWKVYDLQLKKNVCRTWVGQYTCEVVPGRYQVRNIDGAYREVFTMPVATGPVDPRPVPPVANADNGSVDSQGQVTINVAQNDTDANNDLDPSSVVISSNGDEGTAAPNGDGTVTYVHTGSGTSDSFIYTVFDFQGAVSNPAIVTVTINQDNESPVANADFAIVDSQGLVTIDVIANDTDADNNLDPSSVTITRNSNQGIALHNGDGTVNYSHTGANTPDTFEYSVKDTQGAVSNPAEVSIQISQPTTITPSAPIELFNGINLNHLYTFFGSSPPNSQTSVFSVQNGNLVVTGQHFGALTTEQSYRDYMLVLEYRWDGPTWPPRQSSARDAGMMFHSQGEDGGWRNRLKPHLQVQIMEGSTGDLMILPPDDNSIPYSFSANTTQVPNIGGTPYYRNGYVWNPTGQPVSFSANIATVHWNGWDPDWRNVTGYRGSTVVESANGQWNRLVLKAESNTVEISLNGTMINKAYNVTPSEGQIQLESEFAQYSVRRWELLPLGSAVD